MFCKICNKNYVVGNGEGICQECSTNGTAYQLEKKQEWYEVLLDGTYSGVIWLVPLDNRDGFKKKADSSNN